MRLVLLVLSALVFGQIQAFADEAKVLRKLKDVGSLEDLSSTFKDSRPQNNFENAAVRYLVMKEAFDFADEKWYRPYPQDGVGRRYFNNKANYNYFYTKCKLGDALGCSSLEKAKNRNSTFNFDTLEMIDIPKIDAKNGTFTTVDGKTYSAATGKVIAIANPTSTQKTNQKINEVKKDAGNDLVAQVRKIEASEKDDSDFKCEWADLFPRKILHGPGCKAGGSKICTGYVTCSSKNRKVNRLATCSERLCTDSTATECANQLGYGSKNAAGVTDQYRSDSENTDSTEVKSNQ